MGSEPTEEQTSERGYNKPEAAAISLHTDKFWDVVVGHSKGLSTRSVTLLQGPFHGTPISSYNSSVFGLERTFSLQHDDGGNICDLHLSSRPFAWDKRGCGYLQAESGGRVVLYKAAGEICVRDCTLHYMKVLAAVGVTNRADNGSVAGCC